MNPQDILDYMKAILQDAINENFINETEAMMIQEYDSEKYVVSRKETFLNGIRWAFSQLEEYISVLEFLDTEESL